MDNFEIICKEIEVLSKKIRDEGNSDNVNPADYPNLKLPEARFFLWAVPRTTAEFLYDLVLEKKPKVILELGTSSGYSTIWFAKAAKTYSGKVYTMEKEDSKIEMAKGVFEFAGYEDDIDLQHGYILDLLDHWDQPIDLLFIDAEKRFYKNYLEICEKFLKPGSIVVADNILDFGDWMNGYREYVESSEKYDSKLIEMDHGLLISEVKK